MLYLIFILSIAFSKIIPILPQQPQQSNIKQQGQITTYLTSTNTHLTLHTFTNENHFLTSTFLTNINPTITNNTLIHINSTNATYFITNPTPFNIELTQIKFDPKITTYKSTPIPISGCIRSPNTTSASSITLLRSLGVSIYFPSDIFVGGDIFILAATLDLGNNGLSMVGYMSDLITCRAGMMGEIVQMFRNVSVVSVDGEIRTVGVDRKKKKGKLKMVVMMDWKRIFSDVKRKEIGVLLFDMGMDKESMPYCESRREMLQCGMGLDGYS
ncbi:hypothetical protein SBY92_001331 [Candida maltosa Xu316]